MNGKKSRSLLRHKKDKKSSESLQSPKKGKNKRQGSLSKKKSPRTAKNDDMYDSSDNNFSLEEFKKKSSAVALAGQERESEREKRRREREEREALEHLEREQRRTKRRARLATGTFEPTSQTQETPKETTVKEDDSAETKDSDDDFWDQSSEEEEKGAGELLDKYYHEEQERKRKQREEEEKLAAAQKEMEKAKLDSKPSRVKSERISENWDTTDKRHGGTISKMMPFFNKKKGGTTIKKLKGKKRTALTFVPGFNPFGPLTKGEQEEGEENAETTKEEFETLRETIRAANKSEATRDPEMPTGPEGYAKALTEKSTILTTSDLAEVKRTTSFFNTLRGKNNTKSYATARRLELEALQAGKGFSRIDFDKNVEEAKRKASADSVETQLDMKWDDFVSSLPDIGAPNYGKVEEHYDETGLTKLRQQGDKIMEALKLGSELGEAHKRKEEKSDISLAIKFSRSDQDSSKVSVLPSYLENFTGEEEEKGAGAHIGGRKSYAICMFEHANPNIAKDAEYDMLFGECASEAPGLYIWRIEYFMPLEIPADEYPDPFSDPPRRALFYSEDCYIVLHITSEDEAKRYAIFTWVGDKCSRDKVGAAAIRCRELNIFLGGKAELFREEQEHESDDFLEIFDYDIEYLDEGGTESGFKPALPLVQEPRLYRLYFREVGVTDPETKMGRKSKDMFCMSLVEMSVPSLNKSDVFILDGGSDGWLWEWIGSRTDSRLIFKGHEIITRINRYERSCRSTQIVIDEGDELVKFEKKKRQHLLPATIDRDIDEDCYRFEEEAPRLDPVTETRCFMDYMQGKKKNIEDYDIDAFVPRPKYDTLFYKACINKETGKPALETLKTNNDTFPLSKTMLDSTAAFVMDALTEIFVWNGMKATKLQKQIAQAVAKKFRISQSHERPRWCRIITCFEGYEPTTFIAKFPDWCAELFIPLPSNYSTSLGMPHRVAPSYPDVDIKIDDLLQTREPPEEVLFDNCEGSTEVWAVEDGRPTFTKLPQEEQGHFYSGDCFLVLYTYYDKENHNKQSYLCYFWEGRSSTTKWYTAFLFGFYPVLEKKIKATGGKAPCKIRVPEHKEPEHFMKLFGGSIVIHKGHRKKTKTKTTKKAKRELFHIRKVSPTRIYSVQVKPRVGSLYSADAFVLRTDKKIFLWYGKGTKFEDSKDYQESCSKLEGNRTLEVIEEDEELPEFWNILGGWTSFMCDSEFIAKYSRGVRLFNFTQSTGYLTYHEIFNPYQTDLNHDNVYLLDTFHEVYVWIGKTASETLYSKVLAFANSYIREMAAIRTQYVDLITIHPEEEDEPIEFTRHFHTWVTKPPFEDPILLREENYADQMFSQYKLIEQAQRKGNEKKRRQYARLDKTKPIRKLNWVDVILREMPEVILAEESDSSEYSDSAESSGYTSSEQEITLAELEQVYDSSDEDLTSESEEDDDEWRYDEVSDEEEEEVVKEESATEYMLKQAQKKSRYNRIYNTKY